MSTAYILYQTIIHNWVPIFSIIVFFILVMGVGYSIFITFVKDHELYLALPAGFIIGVYALIFYLALLSYLFKGVSGIYLIFFLFISTGVFLIKKSIKKIEFSSHGWQKSFNIQLVLAIIMLGFFFVIAGNNVFGGDVITYWGFANSFVNGNYPVKSPWQPDLLANHHQGVFLFQGVVSALTNTDIQMVHSLFSWAITAAGFFMIWGWVYKSTASKFISIYPGLVTIVAFGLIIFVIPNVFKPFMSVEVDRDYTEKAIIFTDFKNTLGGSSNLNEVFYINHRISAIVGLYLFLILLSSQFNGSRRVKIILLIILAEGIISTDEVVLPAMIASGLIWFTLLVLNKRSLVNRFLLPKITFPSEETKNGFFRDAVFGALFFLLMFFLVGSALRDSILTPAQELPRFQFTSSVNTLMGRFNWLKGAFISDHRLPFSYYFPSALFLILLAVWLILVKRSLFQLLLFGSVIATLVTYFTVDHTYYPGNYGRFQHLLYILIALLISYSTIYILKKSKEIKVKLIGVLIICMYIPGILSSIYYLGLKAKASSYPNLDVQKPNILSLEWYRKTFPSKRLFISDGTFIGKSDKNLINSAIERYGLLVPISPATFKVHTPDWGIEAVDLIYTLNPLEFKELKVDYLLITKDQRSYYNQVRGEDLKNKRYFYPVYDDNFATIFKIQPLYLSQGENKSTTIGELPDLLDAKDKNIYLDYPPRMNFSIRAVLMLALKDSKNLYSEWRSGGFNYIETTIKIQPPSINDRYDYVIVSESTDPLSVCNCLKVKPSIWRINKAIVYEVS